MAHGRVFDSDRFRVVFSAFYEDTCGPATARARTGVHQRAVCVHVHFGEVASGYRPDYLPDEVHAIQPRTSNLIGRNIRPEHLMRVAFAGCGFVADYYVRT